MYCEKCGNQLRDGAKFCNSCGAGQNELAASQSKALEKSTDHSDNSGYTPAITPNKNKKRLPTAKILAGIIFVVMMIIGSVGLIVDFGAANAVSGNNNDRSSKIMMYRAYIEVLENYSGGIHALEAENEKKDIYPMTIALTDIIGDEKEELIFLACDSYPGTEKLHIITYNNSVKEIYSEDLLIYAGQGLQPFMLFTLNDDKSLWLYRQTGDETEISTYYRFEEDDNLNLTKTEKLQKHEVNESISDTKARVWYTKDGKDCDQNTFEEADKYYHTDIEKIVLVGANLFDEEYRNIITERNGDWGYTYDGAIKYLKDYTESTSSDPSEIEDWKSGYFDFLEDEKFRDISEIQYSDSTEILLYLYDLDHDGIPELLMTNGYSGRATRSAYIFTWSGGKVIYLGFGPGEPYRNPDDNASPLYANYWETYGVDHWSVYYKKGNSITTTDEFTAPNLFNNKADFILVQQKGLSEVQADHMKSLLNDYNETHSDSVINSPTVISGNTEKQSPFTVRRIVFGILALLGLGGSTISLIVIIISKQAALTIITIIVYVTSSVGSIGGVTYSAVQNKIFVPSYTSARFSDKLDVDSIPSCEGMEADKAQRQLESKGYSVKTEYSNSDTVPTGRVISQRIEEGTKIIIVIVVSKGSENGTVAGAEKQKEKTTKATEKADEKAPDGYEQKVTVIGEKGSSYATAVLYEWRNGKWEKLASYDAAVGSNGIGDTVEGHSITPQGLHKLGVVLCEKTVNTNMNTYHVKSTTCVVDDPKSSYYNQIMEKSSVPSGTHYDNIGKGLTDGTTFATVYIEHNGNGFSSSGVVPEKGSAIGIRGQNGELKPNYGDVDISAKDMKDLLSKLDANKHPMIEIKNK